MSGLDMMAILADIKSLKIRATYQAGDVGYLSDVHLVSVTNDTESETDPVGWVEQCACLDGTID